MFARRLESVVRDRLNYLPAVALLGPRQAGKTTLARAIADGQPSVYLDLEAPADVEKLRDPVSYLALHERELVVLDEVQRMPGLFEALRGLIDDGRRRGLKAGRFLLLGSAAADLLRQSETLAGRIAYVELDPLKALEVPADRQEDLWVRGGFPESFLAAGARPSLHWRQDFIRTYLERDVPQLGPRIPAATLFRFWTMLAHAQGGIFNAAQLASGLAVEGKTTARYLDLMVDLMLVRRLQPFHANVGKRLVKSPKVYVRDSGLVHALLQIPDLESLLGHPVAGPSWEGFVMENLIAAAPEGTQPFFYRTSGGAEIDLLLATPGAAGLWAFEIKRGLSARPEKGFHVGCADLGVDRRIVVNGGPAGARETVAAGLEAAGLAAAMGMLAELTPSR